MTDSLDIFETNLDSKQEATKKLNIKYLESERQLTTFPPQQCKFLMVEFEIPNSLYFIYGQKLLELLKVMDHYVSASEIEEYEDPKVVKIMYKGYLDKQPIIDKIENFVRILKEKFQP